MKHTLSAVAAAFVLAGCDPEPSHVFFAQPSESNLVGTWSGVEEITTAQDNASNIGYSDSDRGYSFPVVINFEEGGRFTLFTSGYAATYDNPNSRTCSGAYTRNSTTISFFPAQSCRALPMSKYVIGRVLPNGVTLEARSNTVGNSSASYMSMRVFIKLDRD
jgi:hypothetical protein